MKKYEPGDLPRLLEFYRQVAEETANVSKYARWDYGKHPTEKMITDYVNQGVMYTHEEDGNIVAAVAVTPYQTEEYHGINWQAALQDDEVAVVHILAVNPHYQGQGRSRKIMEEVISLARDAGLKAVRLDALECNTPAHRLYESLGFKKCDVRHWYAENTGWIDFYLFEYLL